MIHEVFLFCYGTLTLFSEQNLEASFWCLSPAPLGRSLIKYRFRQFMKGEWSKQPFRVWYNSGTEIWITVFDIRKKNAIPLFIQCWMSRRKLGRSRNPFWRSLWHLKQRPCSNCYNSLFFGGALNLVQLWHRDLKNGKQYDVAVDFHVFNWCWMSRRKLFNLPTQVLNHFLVSNTSAFFQKFHNVDSERLFGSFSLHFLSESHPFWNAPQTAPGAQSQASCLFCVTSTSITTWHYPLRVTRSNSQALFRCPPQSGEHPKSRMRASIWDRANRISFWENQRNRVFLVFQTIPQDSTMDCWRWHPNFV